MTSGVGGSGALHTRASYAAHELPVPVLAAVVLMYCGAFVQMLGLVSALVMMNSAALELRTAHEEWARSQGLPPDVGAAVDTGLGVGIAIAIALSVVAVGLWLWMARANSRGLRWARTVATTLGVLGAGFATFSAIRADTGFTLALNLVMAVLALGIIALLHHPSSRAFYDAVRS